MRSLQRLSASQRSLLSLAVLGSAATLLTGCGGAPAGPTRYTVSGTVTYDKQPVPKGFITFSPDDTAGNKGPGGGAQIINGKFKTDIGKGVVGGPYTIQIVGYDGVPAKVEGEELKDGKPLFSTYMTTLTLPKGDSTQNFDIPKP